MFVDVIHADLDAAIIAVQIKGPCHVFAPSTNCHCHWIQAFTRSRFKLHLPVGFRQGQNRAATQKSQKIVTPLLNR